MHKAGTSPSFPQHYFFLRKWLHAGSCPPPHFTSWRAEPDVLQTQLKAAGPLSSGGPALWRLMPDQRIHRRTGSHNAALTQHWSPPGHETVCRRTSNEYLKGLQKGSVCGERWKREIMWWKVIRNQSRQLPKPEISVNTDYGDVVKIKHNALT